VKAVAGNPSNFKITTTEDLTLARKLMELNGQCAGASGKNR